MSNFRFVSDAEIADFIISRVNSQLQAQGDGEEFKSISIYRVMGVDATEKTNWATGYMTSISDLRIIQEAISDAKMIFNLPPE